jgi:uncharacterized protein (DUF952 family)
MTVVYRIVSGADWGRFREARVFHGTDHDLRDGFIHFSAGHQLAGTAAKHYAGQGDLMLLHVDCEQLPADQLKWEPSRGGDLFPHLYGVLPLEAVVLAEPFVGSASSEP